MTFGKLFAVATTCAFMATGAQAVTISEGFGPEYDFTSDGGTFTFDLDNLDTFITSDLTIDFTVIGDLNSNNENFRLFVDGVNFGRGCNGNTNDDDFGIAGDACAQDANEFRDGQLTINLADAVTFLADGALEIAFQFNRRVDAFVDINNGGETRSGVFFGDANNFSFAAGGTVSYESATTAPVPLPAGAPLLLAGLLAFGFMGRRQA